MLVAGEVDLLQEAMRLMVADVMEAISAHRSHRTALGEKAALAELARGRGTLYDEACVDTCTGLFRERRFSWETSGSNG